MVTLLLETVLLCWTPCYVHEVRCSHTDHTPNVDAQFWASLNQLLFYCWVYGTWYGYMSNGWHTVFVRNSLVEGQVIPYSILCRLGWLRHADCPRQSSDCGCRPLQLHTELSEPFSCSSGMHTVGQALLAWLSVRKSASQLLLCVLPIISL